MTTAPNGELRRQDLHLQVQQLVSLRSLPWVPWVAVPHLPWYYAPLRLPPARLESLRLSLASRYLTRFHYVRGLPRGLVVWSKPPDHARAFGHPVPLFPGLSQGDRWFSQVPELPLWRHAPLSDPGGILRTRR